MIYSNNIDGLIKSMVLDYDATEWRLLLSHPTDVSKVFDIIGLVFSSFPDGHSVQMKETHNSMDYLLFAFHYQEQNG